MDPFSSSIFSSYAPLSPEPEGFRSGSDKKDVKMSASFVTPPRIRKGLATLSQNPYSPSQGKKPEVVSALVDISREFDSQSDDSKKNLKRKAHQAFQDHFHGKNAAKRSSPMKGRLARTHNVLTQDSDYSSFSRKLFCDGIPEGASGAIGADASHIAEPLVRETFPGCLKIVGGHIPSPHHQLVLKSSQGIGMAIVKMPKPPLASPTSPSHVVANKTFCLDDQKFDFVSHTASNLPPAIGKQNELSVHAITKPDGQEMLIGAVYKHGSLFTTFPILILNAEDAGFGYSVTNASGDPISIDQQLIDLATNGSKVVTIEYNGKRFDLVDFANYLTTHQDKIPQDLLDTVPPEVLAIQKNLLIATRPYEELKAERKEERVRRDKEEGLKIAAAKKAAQEAAAAAAGEGEGESGDGSTDGLSDDEPLIGGLFI